MDNLLNASVVAAAVTAIIGIFGILYQLKSKNVTEQRKLWRDQIRDIIVALEGKEPDNSEGKTIAKLMSRINSYGYALRNENKFDTDAIMKDAHIWKLIDVSEKKVIDKDMLMLYLCLLLKQDWERCKIENENSTLYFFLGLSFSIAVCLFFLVTKWLSWDVNMFAIIIFCFLLLFSSIFPRVYKKYKKEIIDNTYIANIESCTSSKIIKNESKKRILYLYIRTKFIGNLVNIGGAINPYSIKLNNCLEINSRNMLIGTRKPHFSSVSNNHDEKIVYLFNAYIDGLEKIPEKLSHKNIKNNKVYFKTHEKVYKKLKCVDSNLYIIKPLNEYKKVYLSLFLYKFIDIMMKDEKQLNSIIEQSEWAMVTINIDNMKKVGEQLRKKYKKILEKEKNERDIK